MSEYSDAQVAQVCHEANRALQVVTGDPVVSKDWYEAEERQREQAKAGVAAARAGTTDEELHQKWVNHLTEAGWVYGETKDTDLLTHPCLVPYDDLPDEQKIKDKVFNAIVQAMS